MIIWLVLLCLSLGCGYAGVCLSRYRARQWLLCPLLQLGITTGLTWPQQAEQAAWWPLLLLIANAAALPFTGMGMLLAHARRPNTETRPND